MVDAAFFRMPATQPPRKVYLPKNASRKRAPKPEKPTEPRLTTYVVDEINAYVAIRNIALAEAEGEPTPVNLERARIANEFVKNCLKPARPLYEAQHLPEADAEREREGCKAVDVRLALLRAHVEAMSRDPEPGQETTVSESHPHAG